MVRLGDVFGAMVPDALLPNPASRAYPVAMPEHETVWTVEMLHELPEDGNRYEIIDGVLLVTPSPAPVHQRAIAELFRLIDPYASGLGFEVFFAPAAITWSPKTEVQPDLLVVPEDAGRPIERFEEVQDLALAVEVLSASSLRADRFTKRREYQRRGVMEYWIVDPAGRSIERWRPMDEEPEILVERMTWQPREGAAPLVIDVVRYFRSVHRER
jgi:Uma2 family endonuclease